MSRVGWSSDEAGFSLLELMVVLAITGAVLAMVTTAAIGVIRATDTVDIRTENVDHARLAVSALSRDLRAAAPPLDGGATFEVAAPTHARFTARLSDSDVPSLIDLRVEEDGRLVERVRQPVVDAAGEVTYPGPWEVRYVASYVHNAADEPVLRYGRFVDGEASFYGADPDPEERRQIRLVRIELSMARDRGERVAPQRITTEVRVPNLRGSL